MKYLLDTHAFLWWILDDPMLSEHAKSVISNGENNIFWSVASSWEIAIKYNLGRLPLPDTPENFVHTELSKNRINTLQIINDHAFKAGQLENYHRDPFDRMLIAQAAIEKMKLITNDRKINQYDVEVVW